MSPSLIVLLNARGYGVLQSCNYGHRTWKQQFSNARKCAPFAIRSHSSELFKLLPIPKHLPIAFGKQIVFPRKEVTLAYKNAYFFMHARADQMTSDLSVNAKS